MTALVTSPCGMAIGFVSALQLCNVNQVAVNASCSGLFDCSLTSLTMRRLSCCGLFEYSLTILIVQAHLPGKAPQHQHLRQQGRHHQATLQKCPLRQMHPHYLPLHNPKQAPPHSSKAQMQVPQMLPALVSSVSQRALTVRMPLVHSKTPVSLGENS